MITSISHKVSYSLFWYFLILRKYRKALFFENLQRCYSYNTPYEKIGDEEHSIADEVPFDIPDSWEWVRFSSVIELQSGQDMTPDKYNALTKGIPYITGASNIENGKVIINRWTEYPKAVANNGDLLLTCKGTVGTMAILEESKVHIARQIMAIRPIPLIDIDYVQIVLSSLVEGLKAAAKSMIPGISREDVLQALLPLPPFAEQIRIVETVKSLDKPLSVYDGLFNALESLNTDFPEQLKYCFLEFFGESRIELSNGCLNGIILFQRCNQLSQFVANSALLS